MKRLKKSQFLAEMYMVALGVNSSLEQHFRHYPKDDPRYLEKYYAFARLAECELVEKSHGWVAGEGYSKECPIAKATVFFAGQMRRKDMVPMESVMAYAMLLLEHTEAAWEEYQTLLAQHEEAKRGLLVGLRAVAAENADHAGLR